MVKPIQLQWEEQIELQKVLKFFSSNNYVIKKPKLIQLDRITDPATFQQVTRPRFKSHLVETLFVHNLSLQTPDLSFISQTGTLSYTT